MGSIPSFPMLPPLGASTFRGQFLLSSFLREVLGSLLLWVCYSGERISDCKSSLELPWSCPEAALQLLGAHSANLGRIWSSQTAPSPIRRESTFWKYSLRKPWTSLHLGQGDRKGRSGKIPVPLVGEDRNSRLWTTASGRDSPGLCTAHGRVCSWFA